MVYFWLPHGWGVLAHGEQPSVLLSYPQLVHDPKGEKKRKGRTRLNWATRDRLLMGLDKNQRSEGGAFDFAASFCFHFTPHSSLIPPLSTFSLLPRNQPLP